MYGFGLGDGILKKVYRDNALKIITDQTSVAAASNSQAIGTK
jgi:hypothetical protein